MQGQGVDATPLSMYVTKPLKCPLAIHRVRVVKTWQFQSNNSLSPQTGHRLLDTSTVGAREAYSLNCTYVLDCACAWLH